MSQPEWSEAFPKPPAEGRLLEAWLTTFDQPDSALLVEHLLPSLLGMDRSPSQDSGERTLFFGDLDTELKWRRGRITIISSPTNGVGPAAQYPWLWRYVSHFTVGAKSRAIQHAKFWAFHWVVGDEEQLDLYISSTNLTKSAFKDQLQAGWKLSVGLGRRATTKAKNSWGDLVAFLEALGTSAGSNAKESISRLTDLLARAECPESITFVTSIPGGEQRGAQALKKLKPSAVHILSPTVGDWTRESLTAWCKDVGIPAAKIHLKWLTEEDRRPELKGWTLTDPTKKVLISGGVQLNRLLPDARFADEHADGDERWSHSKLYLLAAPRKRNRYLLVTSANWSSSAWGAGNSRPRNFELGVLLETDWKLLEEVSETLEEPFCASRAETENKSLQWAEATWDGKRIELLVRSSVPPKAVRATITFSDSAVKQVSLAGDGAKLHQAEMKWIDHQVTPLTARFDQDAETLEVVVNDLRPPKDFSKSPLPEVDPSVADALRQALLLQRYGGPAVDIESTHGRGGRKPPGVAAPTANYTVEAWLDARTGFGVVDQWRAALGRAEAESRFRELLLLDGQDLRAIYQRREGRAAQLVAEELGWRLGKEQ